MKKEEYMNITTGEIFQNHEIITNPLFYVLRDGVNIGRAGNRENALDMIRQEQKKETHYILRANFSIISGREEDISY